MKNKIKLLLLTNILAIFFWFNRFIGAPYFAGSSSPVLGFVMIFLLLYSSKFAYGLLGKDAFSLQDERPKMTMLALLTVPANFIGTVIYILINEELLNIRITMTDKEIKALYKEKKQRDPKETKMDIMFKLGIFLLISSALLFAFTSDTSGVIRVVVFFSLSILSIFLSKHLKKTKFVSNSKQYWLLGMFFFLLSFIASGYIELFGTWFSLLGEGSKIFLGSSFTVLALLSFLSYVNWKQEEYLFGVYGGLLAILIATLRYLGLMVEEVFVIVVPIFVILSIFSNNTKIFKSRVLYEFTNMFLIVAMIIMFMTMFSHQNRLAVAALTLLFLSYIYTVLPRKEGEAKTFTSILAYCVFVPLLISNKTTVDTFVISSALFVSLTYVLSFLYNDKIITSSSLATTNILLLFFFFVSFGGSPVTTLFISMLSIIISLFTNLIDRNFVYENYAEIYSHPVKIAMFIYAAILVFSPDISRVMEQFLALSFITNVLIYCSVKSKDLNDVYKVSSLVFMIFSFLALPSATSLMMTFLMLSAALIYYAYTNWVKKLKKNETLAIFILLLLFIYRASHAFDNILHSFYAVTYIYANVLSLILYLALAFAHRKNKQKYHISLLATALPIIALLDIITNVELYKVLLSLTIVYFTFIVNKLFKKRNLNNTTSLVGIVLALLVLIFDNGYYTIAYTLIVSLFLMIAGYPKRSKNYLFQVGVWSLIATFIFRIKDYIFGAPIYIYFLIVGLILVMYVTTRQLKYDKTLKKEDK